MTAALTRFLEGRSTRERGLLLVLGLVVLPLAFAALVALPLIDARAAARQELADARALQDWYLSRQAEIAALPAAGSAPVAPAGLGGIEAALAQAGLRDGLERLAPVASGGIEVAFSDVPFASLIDWIDHGLGALGYRLGTLTLVRAAPGRVGALVRIAPL